MRTRVTHVGLPLFLAASTTLAAGKAPQPIDRFWSGLGPPRATAEVAPIVALRPPAPDRVRIPGGHFMMGSTPVSMQKALTLCRKETLRSFCDDRRITSRFRAEGESHSVGLDPYEIDRTEVTVEAYGRCVSSGACSPPGYTPGDARFDAPTLPVVLVRWEDAQAFCAFAQGRLPTEAEWEFAARGPRLREFPWGDTYNPRLANHGSFAPDTDDLTDGFAAVAPVGSFPDGRTPQGLLDLAGNAAEWVADFYDVTDAGFGYAPISIMNPKGPATGSHHVVRGGSYADGAAWLRTAARGTISELRSPHVGFRCAYDPGRAR